MGSAEQPPNEKVSAGTTIGVAAVILSISILLSRVLGFLREAVIAYQHGATAQTDAYYAAFTLPDLMSYFLAGGTLSITFIPLFSAYMARDDEEGGWRLFSTVATTMGVALVAVTIAFEFLAPYLVPILFPGFVDPDQLALTVQLTRIVIPAQLCFYVGGLLNATLFVRRVFWPAAIAPLIYNVCIIAGGVLLHPWLGIQGFAVGVLIGAALGPLAVPLFASRHKIRFSPRFAPNDPGFREFVLLALPLMIGVGLVTVDEWLLKYFASSHAHGSLAWLNNSRKLMLVVFALTGQAAGQAALPFLSDLHHSGKAQDMAALLAKSIGRVVFLAAVGAAALGVSAESVVHLVFRRGAFTAYDADMTATLLVCFCLGLAAWAAQTMAVRGFYARKDTLTPMAVASAVVIVVLPLYFVLDRHFGVVGLALASSCGMTINAIVTVTAYRLRTRELPLAPILGGLGRGAIVALTCGALAMAGRHLMLMVLEPVDFLTHLAMLGAQAFAFTVGLALITILWRPAELEFVTDRLRARFARVKP